MFVFKFGLLLRDMVKVMDLTWLLIGFNHRKLESLLSAWLGVGHEVNFKI